MWRRHALVMYQVEMKNEMEEVTESDLGGREERERKEGMQLVLTYTSKTEL